MSSVPISFATSNAQLYLLFNESFSACFVRMKVSRLAMTSPQGGLAKTEPTALAASTLDATNSHIKLGPAYGSGKSDFSSRQADTLHRHACSTSNQLGSGGRSPIAAVAHSQTVVQQSPLDRYAQTPHLQRIFTFEL